MNRKTAFKSFIATVLVVSVFDYFLLKAFFKVRLIASGTDTHLITATEEENPNQRNVLVLGYQRCGSSFVGFIFNENPQAFYMFEPIDGIYCAMYGTSQGWNVPSDIFNYWNGTYRDIPHSEKEAIATSLLNIYRCDLKALPTEVLTHHFTRYFLSKQKSIKQFVHCTTQVERSTNTSFTGCQKHIRKYCPSRFGSDMKKHNLCRLLLWDVRTHASDYNMANWNSVIENDIIKKEILSKSNNDNILEAFRNYHQCMSDFRDLISPCVSKLENVCASSSIQAVKTVRVTMDTVEILLQHSPNINIFHLLRDPRPVSLSRLGNPSFRGKHSGGDIAKEASMFCTRALNDVHIRNKLSEKYPKIYQIIYEDMVQSTLNQTVKFYQYFNSKIPVEVERWIEVNTKGEKNSSAIASAWMGKVMYNTVREVNNACADFYNEVNYTWL